MGFKAARLNAGISVREVMLEMGVTDAAVYQWETGVTMPRASMLVKLAKLYNCTVDELLLSEPKTDKSANRKEEPQ